MEVPAHVIGELQDGGLDGEGGKDLEVVDARVEDVEIALNTLQLIGINLTLPYDLTELVVRIRPALNHCQSI